MPIPTNLDRKTLAEKMQKGARYSELAAEWGVPYDTARMRCRRLGLKSIHGPGIPPEAAARRKKL